MYYFIERFSGDNVSFANSIHTCTIDGIIYDVLKQEKDTSLERISTFIVSEETKTFEKTAPRQSKIVEDFMKKEFNLKMNELLLG